MVIEERVEIGGLQSESGLKKGSSIIYKDDIPSGFIMPRKGIIQVYYGYLTHFVGPMPYYSSLNSYIYKDDSTRTDLLEARFPDLTTWPRSSQFCPPYNWWQYNYFPNTSTYLYEIETVNQGDSVLFTYLSDFISTGDSFYYPINDFTEIWYEGELVGWDIFWGSYDYCLDEYENVLFASIGILKEYELMVSIEPDEISPGDTAEVILKKKLPDGTLLDFDSTQTFEVGMMEGCMSGKLIVGTPPDTGSYFYNVYQPIRFAAADTLVGDSTGIVKIRVGLIDSTANKRAATKLMWGKITDGDRNLTGITEKFKKAQHRFERYKKTEKLLLDSSMYCFNPAFWETEVFEEDTLTIEKQEILLGEMKFFGVKKKTENNQVTKIKIQEIKVKQDSVPKFPTLTGDWSWIKESTIWSGRPINIETHGQSPIFYDKFYATIYDSGTTTLPVIDTLPHGMIRIVGRYLGKSPGNKVKLFTTQFQNFTDTLEIQVIKPYKLGENTLSITGPTKVDYVDKLYDRIDTLLINFAGQLGSHLKY